MRRRVGDPAISRLARITVEQTIRTAEEWVQQFSPSRAGDESWGYAFLDGVPLYDPHGTIAQLTAMAADAHALYHVPARIRAHYLWLWEHTQPKMEAVLRRNDEVEIGWVAAVSMLPLTDTLWAINDRPLPSRDLGTFGRHLDELQLPTGVSSLVRDMLQAPPRDALRLQLRLLDLAMPYLRQHETDERSGP